MHLTRESVVIKMETKKYTIELTKQEIENLIDGMWAQISEYCCNAKEEKPFKDLIDKLEIIKNGDDLK